MDNKEQCDPFYWVGLSALKSGWRLQRGIYSKISFSDIKKNRISSSRRLKGDSEPP